MNYQNSDVKFHRRTLKDLNKNIFGYVYTIKDTKLRKLYIGVRYRVGINIHKDLGIKYFSSSKRVANLIKYSQIPLKERFIFKIIKIFAYNDDLVLLSNRNGAIIPLYKDDFIQARQVLKKKILSYETRLLDKLRLGTNTSLLNYPKPTTNFQGENRL